MSVKARFIGLGIATIAALSILSGSFGFVETGHVGVKKTFSQVQMEEVTAGFYIKMPFVTSITEYSIREIPVVMTDLHPKAKDNLSLQDLDVTVYYTINPNMVADVTSQFLASTIQFDDGTLAPGYTIVSRTANEATNDAVADMESLTIHTKREALTETIKTHTQSQLDKTSPGAFKVTRVIIQAITTDPSIEESIQKAVQAQKTLEVKEVEMKIAQADAEIKKTEAHGIAEANRIINGSLTKEYLQHEANLALHKFAESGKSNTVILPAGMATSPLINVN